MKLMRCTQCGSNELVRDNGYMVCKYCNSRYAIEKDDIGIKESSIELGSDIEVEIPVKEGRRSAPTVRLVRSYRCEAPPSIVKSIVACSHVYKACTMNNIEQKERDQGGVRGCA